MNRTFLISFLACSSSLMYGMEEEPKKPELNKFRKKAYQLIQLHDNLIEKAKGTVPEEPEWTFPDLGIQTSWIEISDKNPEEPCHERQGPNKKEKTDIQRILEDKYTTLHSESQNQNLLVAPGRIAYMKQHIEKPKDVHQECPFCRERDMTPEQDKDIFMLLRGKHCTLGLSPFPYGQGHLLLVPHKHTRFCYNLDKKTRSEMDHIKTKSCKILNKLFKLNGINVGTNMGYNEQVGASQSQHIHTHILPRFVGQHKSFIYLLTGTEVVQYDIHATYDKLRPHFNKIKKIREKRNKQKED